MNNCYTSVVPFLSVLRDRRRTKTSRWRGWHRICGLEAAREEENVDIGGVGNTQVIDLKLRQEAHSDMERANYFQK